MVWDLRWMDGGGWASCGERGDNAHVHADERTESRATATPRADKPNFDFEFQFHFHCLNVYVLR